MGWSGGSEIFGELIDAVRAEVKNDKARERIYKKCLRAFEDADWDTQGECRGVDLAFDRLLPKDDEEE